MNTNKDSEVVESPCVGVCKLDAQNICIGCQRSMDEICEWPGAANTRKREILRRAQRRLAGLDVVTARSRSGAL